MKLQEAVAKRLKDLLAEKGISQYTLFKISGVPQSTISTILNGAIKTIKLSTLHEICSGMGMDIYEFFNVEYLKNINIEN